MAASPKSLGFQLPTLDFLDLPQAPIKARPTASSPPPNTSPTPSPTKKRTIRRRAKKVKEVGDKVIEIIEPLATVTTGRRRSKRRLFYDEVLANQRASKGKRTLKERV